MTMLQSARIPITLQKLSRALGRAGFATQATETGLAFQAAGRAAAQIGPAATPDTWLLEVHFAVDDEDAARAAAHQFAARHGGRLRLRGQTLILSTELSRLDLEHVVALYHTACSLETLLDAGRPHATRDARSRAGRVR